MSKIVYSYNNDNYNITLTFINLYNEKFPETYRHIQRHSFKVETKVNYKELTEQLKEYFSENDLTDVYTEVVRGLSVFDYEYDGDEDDEDELGIESVKKVESEQDYVNSIHAFDDSGSAVSIVYSNSGSHIIQFAVVGLDEEYISALFDKLHNILRPLKKTEQSKSKINFICQGQQGLYLRELKLKENLNFDVDSHYNNNFKLVAEYIEDSLRQEVSKGIILLHGMHGTGKTSYLRHLIHKIDKNIIYVSPDMSARVSEPSFLAFLMTHKNSILIIEDAENVLKTREAGENQAVSNLLNVTDGILGDGLNFQVICTFNTGIDAIDPALRRPGRLIAEYEFTALTEDKTLNLVNSLYGDDVKPKKDLMTLAEIFNMKEKDYTHEPEKKKGGFGFLNR